MSVANPTNEWEQRMHDAWVEVVIDPIVDQVARELGYRGYLCSHTEQKNRTNETQPKDRETE